MVLQAAENTVMLLLCLQMKLQRDTHGTKMVVRVCDLFILKVKHVENMENAIYTTVLYCRMAGLIFTTHLLW